MNPTLAVVAGLAVAALSAAGRAAQSGPGGYSRRVAGTQPPSGADAAVPSM